jgi:predicted ArsR family transcriptional regulator
MTRDDLAGRVAGVAALADPIRRDGYDAQRSAGTIVLRNCPFDALAREHTDLVCGMNLAIMTAVTEQLQETTLAARLEPAPDRCCVVLVPADVPARQPQGEDSMSPSSSRLVGETRTRR